LSLVPDSLTLFAATIAIAAATAAPAQAPLSVETALEQALAHNPRVAAVIHDLRAARQGVRAAGALANPQVAFTPALTGGVGGGSDNELFIAQPLEVNGARSARRGAAEARLRETEAEAAVLLRDVVYEVRAAYYELVRAREQAALARDILAIAGELDRLARVQVELGARERQRASPLPGTGLGGQLLHAVDCVVIGLRHRRIRLAAADRTDTLVLA